MSYCRWSTDDYRCDLYIYHHVDGSWRIEVAATQVSYNDPLPPPVNPMRDWHGWMMRYEVVNRLFERGDRYPITLPHAGDTLSAESAGACADLVEMLRGLGYRCPDDVVPRLRMEAEILEAACAHA